MPDPKPKLAHRLAGELETEILRQGWKVGEVLASQTELRAQFDVSAATLRQTTRLLESRGVAYMRPGPSGGLVVAEPDGREVRHVLATFMTFEGLTAAQTVEARSILELAIVELTASRIDETTIQSLRQRLETEERTLGAGGLPDIEHTMHHEIAAHAGNPALNVLLGSLLEVTATNWRDANYPSRDPEVLHNIVDHHRAVVEAITMGDGALARVRMKHHLDWLAQIPLGSRHAPTSV